MKDKIIKTKVYAEAGIKEYWVANFQKRQLIVFREPQDSEYATKFTLSEGIVYPVSFPSLAVEVNRIISQ